MVEIFFDGVQIYPEDGGTFTINNTNPILSDKEDHTYSISFPLSVPENARAFRHINRLNAVYKNVYEFGNPWIVVKERGEVIIQGTGVLVGIDDNSVEIQVICGLASINFITSDMSVRDIPLWDIPKMNPYLQPALWPFTKGAWVPMVLDMDVDTVMRYKTYYVLSGVGCNFEDFANLIPETVELLGKTRTLFDDSRSVYTPYLMAVIEGIAEYFGYTVDRSTLAGNERLKRAVIVQGYYRAKKVNELLPNWTVRELFSEFCSLFNIVISFDSVNNKMLLLDRAAYFSSRENMVTIESERILRGDKDISVEFEKEEDIVFEDYRNIKYKNLGDEMHLTDDIPTEVEKQCIYETVATTPSEEYYDKFVIFPFTDGDCIVEQDRTVYSFWRIDLMKRVVNDETAGVREFKICPAPIYTVLFGDPDMQLGFRVLMPYAVNKYLDEEVQEGFHEAVQNGLDVPEEGGDIMYIAMNMGKLPRRDYFNTETPETYPMALTGPKGNLRGWQYGEATRIDLSPSKMMTDLYIHNDYIDSTVIYTIQFTALRRPDPMSMFVINDRRFYCKSIQTSIENGQRVGYYKGVFIPAE